MDVQTPAPRRPEARALPGATAHAALVVLPRVAVPRLALPRLALALLVATAATAAPAQVLDCTLDGESVSPYNGATTAGRTGIMRCTEREGGALARETEYRAGRVHGLQRWYEKGVLRREHSVDARGNRDGLAREWTAAGVLVSETRHADGATVGLRREWYDDGTRRSVAHWGDDGERRGDAPSRLGFDRDGRLAELRCGPVPRLDDEARLCGHDGVARPVELHARGRVVARVTYLRGQLQRRELLREDGTPAEVEVRDGTHATVRRFGPDGTVRRETESVDGRRVREATFSERGTPLTERRWSEGLPERESEWYLNGQPRSERVYERRADGPSGQARIVGHADRAYHDTGRVAAEGRWAGADARGARTVPVGPHRAYDDSGRLVAERVYDDRGRITRERDWDGSGRLVRDDEVYEDGSRKRTAPDASAERRS
jgi:antitoxin component YwqK of YwqJK toxin-antitoxin module